MQSQSLYLSSFFYVQYSNFISKMAFTLFLRLHKMASHGFIKMAFGVFFSMGPYLSENMFLGTGPRSVRQGLHKLEGWRARDKLAIPCP